MLSGRNLLVNGQDHSGNHCYSSIRLASTERKNSQQKINMTLIQTVHSLASPFSLLLGDDGSIIFFFFLPIVHESRFVRGPYPKIALCYTVGFQINPVPSSVTLLSADWPLCWLTADSPGLKTSVVIYFPDANPIFPMQFTWYSRRPLFTLRHSCVSCFWNPH